MVYLFKQTDAVSLDAVGICNIETKSIDGGWYEQAGQEWLHCYAPILELKQKQDIPCVLFGAETFEQDIIKALASIGLKYHGGYEEKQNSYGTRIDTVKKSAQTDQREKFPKIIRTQIHTATFFPLKIINNHLDSLLSGMVSLTVFKPLSTYLISFFFIQNIFVILFH